MSGSGPDTIILVSPAEPYVCVGFHQDVDKEVDRAYCRARGWPVLRREVGGGAVYLDRDQIFVQWVFRPSSLPGDVAERFRVYVEPLVRTYRALGVEAEYRPVNDIHVRGRKIGGTGAARIGPAEGVVGSFMLDFDRAAMARVLRVSSEKMRDKVFQGLRDYMTTARDELGGSVDRERLKALYAETCAGCLGADIVPGQWTEEEEAGARDLDRLFLSPDWLEQAGSRRRPGVKIHEDVHVRESEFKAPGGLIRLAVRINRSRIDDVSISGDFTILPRRAVAGIEDDLRGAAAEARSVLEIVRRRYEADRVQSPGLTPEHWAEAFARAFEG
jgi:lipoate-protein ligase A